MEGQNIRLRRQNVPHRWQKVRHIRDKNLETKSNTARKTIGKTARKNHDKEQNSTTECRKTYYTERTARRRGKKYDRERSQQLVVLFVLSYFFLFFVFSLLLLPLFALNRSFCSMSSFLLSMVLFSALSRSFLFCAVPLRFLSYFFCPVLFFALIRFFIFVYLLLLSISHAILILAIASE